MTPLALPRITSTEAQALNAIVRALNSQTITTPGDDSTAVARLSISSLPPGADPPVIVSALVASIEWAGARFQLELPAPAIDAWAAQSLGSQPAALPAPWREAAMARGLDWLCEALSGLERGRARCTAIATGSDSAIAGTHRLLAQIVWPDSGNSLAGLIHTDSLGLLVCASLASAAPAPSPSVLDAAGIPFHLSLCIGESDIPIGRLSDLGRGDVILIARPFLDGAGAIQLRALSDRAAFSINARLDGSQLILSSSPIAMTTDSPPAEQPDDASVPLDQIPVRLSFDVGTKTLTLAELQALQPGSTFALDRPPNEYLTIRANGAPIGTGHLVDIDGRLGVAVTSLSAPRGSA